MVLFTVDGGNEGGRLTEEFLTLRSNGLCSLDGTVVEDVTVGVVGVVIIDEVHRHVEGSLRYIAVRFGRVVEGPSTVEVQTNETELNGTTVKV